MAVDKLGQSTPPVVPVQPSPPPAPLETPPDGQTGAALARLALQLAQGAAANPMSILGGETTLQPATLQAAGFDAGSFGIGGTSSLVSADPSVETFARDYLDKPADMQPETGRSNNLRALFARNNTGQNPDAI